LLVGIEIHDAVVEVIRMSDVQRCAPELVSLLVACVITSCGVADPPSDTTASDDSASEPSPTGAGNDTATHTAMSTSTANQTKSSQTTRVDSSTSSVNTSSDPGSGQESRSSSNASNLTSNETSSASDTEGNSSQTSPLTSEGATGGMTTQEVEPLDCGPDGWAVEDHGPPENRANYIILADGYDETTVHTTLEQHIHTAMQRRFEHESGEPYGRYRKFVNICVMKVVSETNGIGNGPTAFDGGNGGDRLAAVNSQKVRAYLNANLPERLEPSWTAVVLNQDLWENTGSILMLWSGAHEEAPGAALHEGGHGFHGLADEYGTCTGLGCGEDTKGTGNVGTEYQEVNSSGNPSTTDGKWDLWLGHVQKALKDPAGEATGIQSTFSGSRYESPSSGQYRPSDNSMMNSLFGLSPDTSFNSVSREQMVFSIWQFVRPIDSTVPEQGPVGPGLLRVNVVDPQVINVDWSVDGVVVAENAGTTFDTAVLARGEHTVEARAYDNATEDLVRLRTSECPSSVTGAYYCHATAWKNSEQTVQWSVVIP
jgi:hypothetical protein